jgi:hypothetical protein
MIGSANDNRSTHKILFLLFVNPKAGIISQFVAAIIKLKVIHDVVEVSFAPVADSTRLDPHIGVTSYHVGRC